MKENNLIEFDAEILACKKRIKEIEPYINKNEALASLYNRLLVEKAVLLAKKREKKEDKKTKFVRQLFAFDRRKKLICDYFQESF